ncbi:hypothetical protein K445DRAFT_143611 [Daldinia sp. EC12]|nr:hypothetical protein K445DRAFT_143611 [Daldinia sp. EC12]
MLLNATHVNYRISDLVPHILPTSPLLEKGERGRENDNFLIILFFFIYIYISVNISQRQYPEQRLGRIVLCLFFLFISFLGSCMLRFLHSWIDRVFSRFKSVGFREEDGVGNRDGGEGEDEDWRDDCACAY